MSITETGLRPILEQFGALESVMLHRDEAGNSKVVNCLYMCIIAFMYHALLVHHS